MARLCGILTTPSRRLSSPRWWETQLRREINQIKEHLLISLGMVQAKKSLYISNETIMLSDKGIRERITFLNIRKVVNIETQEENETLLQMAMSGIANPRIQKSELTQILFGTYNYALQHNHACRFITITLPESFHATTIDGTPCSGWKGLTPKQAHDYLQKAWTKARSALSGIACYGTRFVEPHHDSTPHWHLLIYTPQDNDSKVTSTINKYFSQIFDSSSLDGIVDIKPVTNEAILHYMMKFLASSFPGVADEKATNDKTGKPISCEAKNAKLWSSQWGIRRFQHFGLPEIGVWRECRKVRSHNITHELGHAAEAVRHAADHGDFQRYIDVQGGVGIKRSQRVLHVERAISPFDNIWGEEKTIIIGIKTNTSSRNNIFRTREIHYSQQEVRLLDKHEEPSISCNIVNNCRMPTILSLSTSRRV
ncbi:replication endonuclease [Citrobacter braakii]|uniref:replication endonuclease n=1 Tax=Citrobacter braakii TaxID=57706 RepID=UPI00397CC6A5